ncbi:MAG: glycosyltransferase family 2 protein [Candidatus Krumholzibacteriota bacterium]|nr:glycosyltransferase family 2 protein [Candidatus Krumholzibacteriota bacterium]
MYGEYGAIIPALNEAKHISEVISRLKRFIPETNIILVDDGSEDDTAALAAQAQVTVVRHPENRGKGASLKSGFQKILEFPRVEAVFTLDGDGQHDPAEIPVFVEEYRKKEWDIIIGSRADNRTGMPPIRRITNTVTSWIMSLRVGCRIEDSQSGYRLIKTELLRNIGLVTNHYETESEIVIKAGARGGSIGSVPIKTIYADEKSKVRPFRDTVRFLKVVVNSFFW